jgi:hypothetical protein
MAKRILLKLGRALGLGVVFVVAAAAALLLHVNSRAERRVLAQLVPRILNQNLQGSFSLEGIERIGTDEVVFREFTARDPKGREVVRAAEVRVRADLPALISALVAGPRRLTIVLDQVNVSKAACVIYDDSGTAIPSIADAFTPRTTPGTSGGRPVRLAIRAIEIDRVRGHGKLGALPPLDARLEDVRGWLRVSELGVDLSFQRFRTEVSGLPRSNARGVSSLRLREPGWLRASFDGTFGDIAFTGTLRRDDEQLSLTLNAPKIAAEEARRLVPAYPLVDDVRFYAELAGSAPALVVASRVEVGEGVILGNGTLDLSGAGHARLDVIGRRVNVRSVVPGAPPTALHLVAEVDLAGSDHGLAVGFDAEVEPSLVSELLLPPFQASGRYAEGRFSGRALLREPGCPLRVTVNAPGDGAVEIDATARQFELGAVERLKRKVAVSGRANLNARARLEQGAISGNLELALSGFRYQNLSIERASINAKTRGKTANPNSLELDGGLAASGIAYGAFALDRLSARMSGPVSSPRVQVGASDPRGASINLEGVVSVRGDAFVMQAPKLELRRESLRAYGKAASVSIGEDRVSVREVALDLEGRTETGAASGTLRGTLSLEPHLLELDARAEALDLTAAKTLLGLGGVPLLGKLSFDTEVVVSRELSRGRVSARLEQATIGPAKAATVTAEARLEGSNLILDSGAQFEGLAEVRARLNGELAGSPLELASYREMSGEAVIDLIRAELGALAALTGESAVPPLSGSAGAELKLVRRRAAGPIDASLLGYTEGLGLDLPREGEPLRLRGMDLRFGASVQGEGGETELNLRVVDARDALATLTLQTAVDLGRLLGAPERALSELRALRIAGKIRIEEQQIDRLPEPLRPRGVTGKIGLEANLAGTLGGPDVFARASLRGLDLTSVRSEHPLDVCASIGFDHTERRLAGSGEIFLSRDSGACTGRRFVRYALEGRFVPDRDSELGRPEGTLVAEFERLPLGALPSLGDQGLSGLASGTLSLSRSEGPPVIFARFDLSNTRVHDAPVGDGTLEVRSNDRAIAAALTLARDSSRLSANALALLDTSRALPTIDPREPLSLHFAANQADAVVLLPFTRDLFSELSGRIDGEADVLIVPRDPRNPDAPPSGKISGRATLHDGSLQLAGLGLRLNSVELAARAEPRDSQTLISVDALQARAGKRKERLAVRHGKVWLDGIRLARAEGTIEVTELPLLLEGVSQATATTRQGVGFQLARTPTRMEVKFDVPYLNVVLPQSSARGVISLAENRSIEILQPLGEPKRSSGEGLPWLLQFDFGRNVQITRSDLDLPLTGRAQVLLAEKTEVTGDLELLPGGRIQVSGKTFVIESGEAHFDTGDATNPRLRVTASWRAPDGTIVLADVSGTYEQARLRLSSDPPRNEQEIYALLLGGSGSGEGGDPTATGAGVGADLLGSLLVNTPLRQVEFRAGSEQLTDQRSYSTYTAAVPISENVWFEGSYKSLNTSDPTQERDAFSGTVDWRFRKNWSLRTEVGTVGTGLDLVWQYRY